MSKTSRQNRKDNEINARIGKNTDRINSVENEVKTLRREYNEHILGHILNDLQQERFLGSGKPMYTYQEIADRHNTSASTVNRIAEEHGLQRRGNKTS